MTPEQQRFLDEHRWALLATVRGEGRPQVTMVAYHWDGVDAVCSVRSTAAKWANIGRHADVALTIVDDDRFLSVSGVAEQVVADPQRRELTIRLRDSLQPEHRELLQADIDAGLDARQRVVIRIRPSSALGRI